MNIMSGLKVLASSPHLLLGSIELIRHLKQLEIDVRPLTPRSVELSIDFQQFITGLESVLDPAFGGQRGHLLVEFLSS